MRYKIIITLLVLAVILAACSEKAPKRDHIPIIKQRLVDLQTAVKDRNRAAIDSLLSTAIFDFHQSSDSLLNYVYGPNDDFAFETFGQAGIIYTNDQAQISCYIMDSTQTTDRPFILNYRYEHDLWLVSSFEPGKPIVDSAVTEAADVTE